MGQEKPFGRILFRPGAMKSGTAWMHSMLMHHPQIHTPHLREIHYFGRDRGGRDMMSKQARLATLPLLVRVGPGGIGELVETNPYIADFLAEPVDDDWYWKQMAPEHGEPWSADLSNLNANLTADMWSSIAEKCEDIRILFVLRSPIRRIWSSIRMTMQRRKSIPRSGKYNRIQHANLMEQREALLLDTDYGRHIRTVLSVIPSTKVLVLFYEDLVADPLGFMRQVERFAGVEEVTYPAEALTVKKNVGFSMELPDLVIDEFSSDVGQITQEVADLGLNLPDEWMNGTAESRIRFK